MTHVLKVRIPAQIGNCCFTQVPESFMCLYVEDQISSRTLESTSRFHPVWVTCFFFFGLGGGGGTRLVEDGMANGVLRRYSWKRCILLPGCGELHEDLGSLMAQQLILVVFPHSKIQAIWHNGKCAVLTKPLGSLIISEGSTVMILGTDLLLLKASPVLHQEWSGSEAWARNIQTVS